MGDMSVGRGIGAAIFVIVAMCLFPTVVYYSTAANVNATGVAATLLPLIQVFYIIGVFVAVIYMMVPLKKIGG